MRKMYLYKIEKILPDRKLHGTELYTSSCKTKRVEEKFREENNYDDDWIINAYKIDEIDGYKVRLIKKEDNNDNS